MMSSHPYKERVSCFCTNRMTNKRNKPNYSNAPILTKKQKLSIDELNPLVR